jgi:hypothetical protein
MIRYSSYGATNYRAQNSRFSYLEPLEADYRELLELRERVKNAEAASKRLRSKRRTGAPERQEKPPNSCRYRLREKARA